MPRTNPLLAGTVVPVVIGLAVAAGGGHALASAPDGDAPAVAPPQHDAGALRLASCNPCGPCNPCNPCAAACNPCNPCRPCASACAPVQSLQSVQPVRGRMRPVWAVQPVRSLQPMQPL